MLYFWPLLTFVVLTYKLSIKLTTQAIIVITDENENVQNVQQGKKKSILNWTSNWVSEGTKKQTYEGYEGTNEQKDGWTEEWTNKLMVEILMKWMLDLKVNK